MKNRGLTRLLFLVTDDFSGLAGLIKGLFPQTDHQLCCVHLFRNAHRRLNPEDYQTFRHAWQEIASSSSFDTAGCKLLDLLNLLRPKNLSWIEYLEKRIDHYLLFMQYPKLLRKHLHSTNLPEGINNQIETMRRNAGGHFHSQREASIKMKLLSDRLYQSKWKNPHPIIKSQQAVLNHIFKNRFENELNHESFLTQYF